MTIASKYEGKCRACGGRVHVGDSVQWVKGTKGVTHTQCPDNPEPSRPASQRPASPKQLSYLLNLLRTREWTRDGEVVVPDPDATSLILIGEGRHEVRTSQEAKRLIDALLACGRKAQPAREVKVTEPGVYKLDDGSIFVVQRSKQSDRLYAKKMHETGSQRVSEAGTFPEIDFAYDRGAIYSIEPRHKMGLEEAKELTIRYGRCIRCGRFLKVKESVERGIGPVCAKYFRSEPGSFSMTRKSDDDYGLSVAGENARHIEQRATAHRAAELVREKQQRIDAETAMGLEP